MSATLRIYFTKHAGGREGPFADGQMIHHRKPE